MLVLVLGGSGSGKSEFAENLLVRPEYKNRIYIATMVVRDEEGRAKAQRHRDLRAHKNFVTVEATDNLNDTILPQDSVVLLEDLSNLSANEFFSKKKKANIHKHIMDGIEHIQSMSQLLVIVSNDLFTDGITYDLFTNEYLDLLSALNLAIAQKADAVYELVCGIPTLWKGEPLA